MRRKRARFVLSAVALAASVALAAAACTTSEDEDSGTLTTAAEGSSTTAGSDASDEHVVYEVGSNALLKHYFMTVAELNSAEEVDLIVKGEVLETRDTYVNHEAYRILTVGVDEVYKGEITKRITVYEDGGLIPLSEVLPDWEGKFDPNTLSKEEIEHGVVAFSFMGAKLAEKGDKVVLYLCKNPNPSQGDSYQPIMGPYSHFTLDETTGRYVRPDMEEFPEFESDVSKESMESALGRLKSR